MKAVKIFKLIVHNGSNTITNEEIYQCLKLLPKEYQNINPIVYIHGDYKSYLKFCLRHLRFNDILDSMIDIPFESVKIGTKITLGVYKPYLNEIHLHEYKIHKFLVIVKSSVMQIEDAKNNMTTEVWNIYENMWIKYILYYNLVHELNHCLQKKERKLNIGLKKLMIKWNNSPNEIDSAQRSERIYKKYGDKFNKILKTEGIIVYHKYENGLDIGYEYSIEVDEDLNSDAICYTKKDK